VIELVFENLINNALKYQEVTNNARIEITQEENQKEYTFYISDNGIGIEPKFNNLIFEPFKRLHNDRVYKGSGLGLATCNRMLKHIGGSISVTPNMESGSCFSIKIPKHNEIYNSAN
jgi:signal transduction histidine kinase